MNDKIVNTDYDVLYLVKCGINEQIPDKSRIEKMNLDEVYEKSKFHSLVSLVSLTLESAGIVLSSEWKQAKEKVIRKLILFEAERAQILKYFEDNGIWHMSLKGIYLKDYYPKFGMREMTDNDILYDRAFQQQVYDFMTARGYHCELLAKNNHDEYLKQPIYNFELHTGLANKSTALAYKYYKNVKDRLVLKENRKFEYNFTDEDLYIYITFHEYKHYTVSGTGLRSLVDTYLYLKKMEDKLDWRYIEKECKKLNMWEFENQNRLLSQKLFGEKPLSEDEKQMLERFLVSGTYGSFENEIKNRINATYDKSRKNYKFKYVLRRLFPPMLVFKIGYPFCYKTKVLIPVAWVMRLFRGIFVDREKISSELKILNKEEINK